MDWTANELVKDPTFQLNALLWLTQPLPVEVGITPLLHQRGFKVYAIAPLLSLPPEVRLRVGATGMSVQDTFRPDVVLAKEDVRKFVLAECKGAWFGSGSSTAAQARSLMISAGPLAADVLGLARGQVRTSLLAYAVPQAESELLGDTLAYLFEGLAAGELSPGPFSVLGLSATNANISIIVDEAAHEFFELPFGANPFIQREPDTDPRPLYFIPYDPDVDQSEREKDICKRILYERMHSTVVAAVGRAHPPVEIVFNSVDIINDATFGMYAHWENRQSQKNMRRMCGYLMGVLEKAVNAVSPNTVVESVDGNRQWVFRLRDLKEQDQVIDTLTRFSCETMDLRAEPQPTLFDGAEDESSGG